jgi:hypothetical protein
MIGVDVSPFTLAEADPKSPMRAALRRCGYDKEARTDNRPTSRQRCLHAIHCASPGPQPTRDHPISQKRAVGRNDWE